MPELPDIELYRLRLEERVVGATVESFQFFNSFVLRSFDPSPNEFVGREILAVERLGKRLVIVTEGELFVVIHLMIAGRLQWVSPLPEAKRAAGRFQLAAFRFTTGQLTLVEATNRKRASVHLVRGREALAAHNPGGINPLTASPEEFSAALLTKNRTLKRALTDPRSFDGIGNAYSDEILHAAGISPVRLTSSLQQPELERLRIATSTLLANAIVKLQHKYPGFPKPADVTAFRPEFAVHGKFGEPCPTCGAPVQRIVYAENETNYCAKCQNEGRLLADRSLSRLLKSDWPRTLEEMIS